MEIEKIMEFLETEILYAIFSAEGLKFLSLKKISNTDIIELKKFDNYKTENPMAYRLIEETSNFLDLGYHNMILDLNNFTQFQQAVFAAVSKVGKGNICTYKELAIMLGKPGAAQAVGNAVGKNPVSYFLPTHRILPQNGIGLCRSGAGHLREKLLIHEGHDLFKLSKGRYCTRKNCNGR